MAGNRALSTFAFLCFVIFLGVLIWRVPRLDLGIVAVVTLLLAGYDLWRQLWRGRSR